jgi:hypothetical protein
MIPLILPHEFIDNIVGVNPDPWFSAASDGYPAADCPEFSENSWATSVRVSSSLAMITSMVS